jgi:hypothetical protein
METFTVFPGDGSVRSEIYRGFIFLKIKYNLKHITTVCICGLAVYKKNIITFARNLLPGLVQEANSRRLAAKGQARQQASLYGLSDGRMEL